MILRNVLSNTKFSITYSFSIKNYENSFSKTLEEALIHIFCDYIHVKSLLEKLQKIFQNDIVLPSLTPLAEILRLANERNSIYNILNCILLVFEYYVYRSWEKNILNIDILLYNLTEIKKKKKRISFASKNERYNKKWCIADNALPVI